MDLKDRVVLITGSSSGIGRETALLLAQKGCNVIITYNKEKESGTAVCEECRKYGDALLIHLDLTNDTSIERAVKTVLQTWGKIDILVNNAGVVIGTLFINQSKEDIETQLNVNLLGLMKVTRAFLPQFYEQGEGIIINIGSTAGKNVLPGVSVYSAAKAGLDAFTAALSQELPAGVRIYCVYPGTTATKMTGYGGKDPARVAEIIVRTAEETLQKKSGDNIYVERFLGEMMRASEYNVFFPHEEGFILFNTLRGSAFVVDSEMKTLFEKNETSFLDPKVVEPFRNAGVLVHNDVDEKGKYRYLCDTQKSDTAAADFHIITTYQCNLSCAYCHEAPVQAMDEKACKCVTEFIKDVVLKNGSNRLGIELAGGEPLLNMPINVMIAEELHTWCHQTNTQFFLKILTNGTLLTPETIEKLAAHNCQVVTQLDGPRKIHNQRRIHKNGKGTFDEIVAGLHRVTDYGLECVVQINVDETNKDYIVSLLQFLKDENLHTLKISITPRVSISPACRWNTYCLLYDGGSIVCSQLLNAAEAMNFHVEQPDELSPRRICAAQKNACFTVDPYLRLFKCAVLPPSKKNAVGIIDHKDCSPLFNQLNDDFLSRDPLAIDECRTCNLLPACGGGCPARVLDIMGTTHGNMCNKSALSETLRKSLTAYLG